MGDDERSRLYVFADEFGNFDFRNSPGATEYYILTTVTTSDVTLGTEFLQLRRDLALEGMALESTFHATEDPQAVRDQVFNLLTRHDFRVDSTIIHKRKTIPRLQADHERFYKQLWFLHFKYVCPRVTRGFDDMLVVAAQIGTKKRRKAIRYGIADVVNQSAGCNWEVAFWPADSDPLLQVADYCCWAIQRKYERDDTRSYDLISDKVRSEFQPFRNGAVRY